MIAFTTNVAEHVGREARYLHFGLTSNDVVDTAQALQIRDASAILLDGLARLGEVLKKRAIEFKHTPMIGRTHGIHAEPITFGWKLAIWYEESRRNTERLKRAAEEMRVGKISGAVGTYAHLQSGAGEKDLRETWPARRAHFLAGDPARPARPFTFARWP